MNDKYFHAFLAFLGAIVGIVGLVIAYKTLQIGELSYIETKQNHRLVEIREFIAMSEEQQDAYLAARKDD